MGIGQRDPGVLRPQIAAVVDALPPQQSPGPFPRTTNCGRLSFSEPSP